jgi:hypothetical protein
MMISRRAAGYHRGFEGHLRGNQNRFCSGRPSRIAVAILIGWTTIADSGFAQVTQAPDSQQSPAPAQTKVYSLTDLEYLLGPIALYPDPLLTLILTASAFPLQIIQADRWLIDNADAAKRGDFSPVDSMAWDSSVQALTRFPDVVQMLSDHLDWTESLGTAFSSQAEDVANVIQLLRAQAESKGNLKSTPEQVVTTRDESGSRIIYIAPANPERIYVPVYDSSVVFSDPLAGALIFGAGVLVGSTWNNRWGWNNRRWNQVWVSPPAWHPPPPNWRPPQRPGARPPGIWRPDRPGGGRPDRPGTGRPDRPGLPPDRPGAGRPDRPGAGRPDRPGTGRPDRPDVNRPDRPGAGRPDRPDTNGPDRPRAGRRDRQGTNRPERPAARPNRPGADRPTTGQRPSNSQRRQAGTHQRSRQNQTQRSSQRARQQHRARPHRQEARPRQGSSTRPNQRSQPRRSPPAATPGE